MEPQGPIARSQAMSPEAPKLVYVDDSLPGITRRRSGRGWAYYDPQGQLIRDRDEIHRLNSVALPPAYRKAWFCPAPNGHILATGMDTRGRKQYRYHPEFRVWRESCKFDGCLAFGKLLPLVRKRVQADLASHRPGKNEAVASVIRLLDTGFLRIGNEAYVRSNRSFGATTLRKRHAVVSGNTLRLRYRGKSGQEREVKLTDRNLVQLVKRMQDLPGQHLFQYIDEAGICHQVGSSDVNDYLRETMNDNFTAKDFRTWHASVLAFELLVASFEHLTMTALLQHVADNLGNTPAVARKSYVHPAVIDLLGRQHEWRAGLVLPRSTKWLTREERGLVELLEDNPRSLPLLAA